jgi:hypothetical protein
MASEQQKQAVLQAIKNKIDIADRVGLKATAQSWRELYGNIAARPAIEIVMALNAAAVPEV